MKPSRVERTRAPRAMIRARAMNSRARLLVRDQVELAAAVARLDVGQPVVLVGRRAQRLGEQLEALDAQRELAAAGADRDAVDADQVAEVERRGAARRPRPEHVDARVQLDRPVRSTRSRNAALARLAPRGEPPGDAVVSSVSSPASRLRVLVEDAAIGSTPGKRVREGAPVAIAPQRARPWPAARLDQLLRGGARRPRSRCAARSSASAQSSAGIVMARPAY